MPAVVLVGAQWGDEGKGKATDLMGGDVDFVVKFNGGNNAGHTVVIEGAAGPRRSTPSTCCRPASSPRRARRSSATGSSSTSRSSSPRSTASQARGIDTSRLLVSANAHVIPPYNRTLDKVTERFLGARKIGTTGRGIGPTYADKMSRVGIRVQDLFDEHILRQKVEAALRLKNQVLVKIYNTRAADADLVVEELLGYAERLRPMVADTSLVLDGALTEGRTVLLEAGQATLLDVDHGTYPFVTSSSATAGGACTGSGIAPTRVSRVIAVFKAYTTRVGEGPFPTELLDDMGEHLRTAGGEYGTTTGRPRRCGWADAVDRPLRHPDQRRDGLRPHQARRPHRAGHRPDLRGLRRRRAAASTTMPVGQSDFHHAGPIYEELDGWTEDITGRPDLRRAPGQRPGLRPAARGAHRSAHLGDRRRAGPARDHRAVSPCSAERRPRRARGTAPSGGPQDAHPVGGPGEDDIEDPHPARRLLDDRRGVEDEGGVPLQALRGERVDDPDPPLGGIRRGGRPGRPTDAGPPRRRPVDGVEEVLEARTRRRRRRTRRRLRSSGSTPVSRTAVGMSASGTQGRMTSRA